MYIGDVTGCCSANILADFGGGHVGETEDFTKQEVIRWVKKTTISIKKRS